MFREVTISKIRPIGRKAVYDITVEGSHTFVANNILHHNSQEPNYQNLPRKNTNPDIKTMMIPRSSDRLFIMADLSQAEYRMMAHISGDKNLLKVFKEGTDLHTLTAATKYSIAYDELEKILKDKNHQDIKKWEMRRKQAKTVNFSIIYEVLAKTLSENLTDIANDIYCSIEEAQQFIDSYFKLYPGVRKYFQRQHKMGRDLGYVESLFGRRRRVPGIWSNDKREVVNAEHACSNQPIQSTATDITLFSSILIWEKIRKGELPQLVQCTTVHDSLVYDVPAKDITPKLIWELNNILTIATNWSKKYWDFEIKDIDVLADFGVGRHYAEELQIIPGYDYTKLLEKDFNKEEYNTEATKFADIPYKDYKKLYGEYWNN